MPKPKGVSALHWRQIERRVRNNCQRKARQHGWDGARTDKCIYGTLNNIRKYIEARGRKDSNVQQHTGAKT